MRKDEILDRLAALPGEIGFYYKNLSTGETLGYHENELFESASVIKLPVYAVLMKLRDAGELDFSERLVCREEDKLPSCGALQYFTGEVSADIRTLCGLMISLSDNSATNLLLRRMGLDFLNEQFKAVGLARTHLERLLFDGEAAARGLENRIVPAELGALLEQIARGGFVSEAVSAEMLALMSRQQVKHKIPGYLPRGTQVAHKTGEDAGITNDVGVVFAAQPFVLCFASNRTDVPQAERALREIALCLYESCS
ncbi:MAG: serine hydrolase [Oscillospiraceae bacterium]|nr:serine hydrolase [Oscillospiraceae bacterium]